MTKQDKTPSAARRLLAKLLQKWSDKTGQIQKTYGRIGAMGPSEGLKPKLLGKLGRWLEQVARLEKDEADILSEIKAVERRHRQLREKKALRRATPKPLCDPVPEPRPKRPQSRFWQWLLILMIFAPPKPKAKNEPRND